MNMKNILQHGGTIALVIVLAVAAVAMPVSARTVASNGAVFDYELNLDVSSVVGAATAPGVPELVKFVDDDPSKETAFIISVANPTDLDLTAIALDGNYGKYYGYDSTGGLTGTYVTVYDPSMSLDAVLDASVVSSIDGKNVSRNTDLAFVIDAPEVATYLSATPATVRIELTTPGGATTTRIGDTVLTGIALSSPRVYVRGLDVSGMEDGTYTAQAKWQTPAGFADYAADSNTVTFTIATIETTIEANKECLVRDDPFVVYITGDSKMSYYLYIKDAGVKNTEYPVIKAGQPDVNIMDNVWGNLAFPVYAVTNPGGTLANNERATNTTYVPGTAAIITTNASGTRSVEFATNGNTKGKTFTIKVVDPFDASKYDEVKVKVEEGEVTITAEGSGSYYFGEEVKLSGTDTDSDDVYLFMTGPNLGDGVSLDDTSAAAANGNYVHRCVESDDTWDYRWDTYAIAGTALEAGTYTIYAAATNIDEIGSNIDAAHLQGVCYASVSFELSDPTLEAGASSEIVARGDRLRIEGTATGSPYNVQIWIMGDNYRDLAEAASVRDDASFEYSIERADTAYMGAGNYTVIVQHPMKNGVFDVRAANPGSAGPYTISNTWSMDVINLGGLSASDAVAALVDMIDSPNCDDTYREVTFTLEEPWILIDEIGERPVGDRFFIDGTTNLADGDVLTVDVSGSASSVSGTATVTGGEDGLNTWSYYIDTSSLASDNYTVCVESMEVDVMQTARFKLSGSVPCTLVISPENSTVAVGGTNQLSVVLEKVPQGLSGFEITIDLTGASNAEITKVNLPSWAGLSTVGSLPADTLTIRAADLNNQVRSGGSEITLCTLSVRGDAAGSTGVAISSATVDSDVASRYVPVTRDGLLDIIAILPFQNPDGGAYPLPTDPDENGMYEDLDGNGWIGFNDVVIYFNGMSFIENSQPVSAFDYDQSGFIGFNDVVELFRSI